MPLGSIVLFGAKLMFKDIDGRSVSEVDDFHLSFYRFSDQSEEAE